MAVIFLGIDPGVSGGIAWVGDKPHDAGAIKMPATDRDLLEALGAIQHNGGAGGSVTQLVAILERASSSPQMGVVSAFTFGRGYGALQMALTASRIRFDLVTPQQWQRALGCRSGGDKNVTKRRAQQLFPDFLVTHATADALLLAEFCRRVNTRAQ